MYLKTTLLHDKTNSFNLWSTTFSKKWKYATFTARSNILFVITPLLNVDINAKKLAKCIISFKITCASKKREFYHPLRALSYGTEAIIIIVATYHLVNIWGENSRWQLTGCRAFSAKTRQWSVINGRASTPAAAQDGTWAERDHALLFLLVLKLRASSVILHGIQSHVHV